mgnify:CR=1 FL=1
MNRHPICTLTMNPALDVASEVERVEPTHKLRCTAPRYDPGGGGINVARVVHTLGGRATALYPAGGSTGAMLTDLLHASEIAHHSVPIAGQTRESFTVNELASGDQYRFVMPGPTLSAGEQQRCLQALAEVAPKPHYLVASGSLPPGVPPAFYGDLARAAKNAGVKLILDSSGEALRQAGHEGVYLMKPNKRELSQLVDRPLDDEQAQLDAAREVIAEQRAEVVVLSLGAEGALLVAADGHERVPALDVPVRSAVGAGDTMVGALVWALACDYSLQEALRWATAAAAATVMTPGTELCRKDDVERLYQSLA